MASILTIGDRWRAQVRQRGQSISKTFRTKGAAEAWAREIEGGIDKGQGAVDEKSNEDYMLKRLESHFVMRWRRSCRPSGWSSLRRSARKRGAEQYAIDMDISKLGTVYKHMASLLDLRLPHAPSIARPRLDHLQPIGPGKHRDRRPTCEEIVKIFEWFAEHPERKQAVPDVIRIAMKSAFRR